MNSLSTHPLVLDAGIGTRLIALGLDLSRDDPCLWSLDHPDSVLALHHQDRQAGADVLLTNTFGASPSNLARLNRADDAAAVLRASVSLARQAAGPSGFVAGSIGPVLNHNLPEYQSQVDHFDRLGVDLLIFETQTAESALSILDSLSLPSHLPVIVSLYRLPDPPSDALSRLADLGLAALGVNCVPGPSASVEAIRKFPRALPLLAKPAASSLDPPETFAAAVPLWLSLGVRLMGGCCGTSHEHVAAIRHALDTALSSPPDQPL
jgi:methionine synthase I (cobalamin-dependent)